MIKDLQINALVYDWYNVYLTCAYYVEGLVKHDYSIKWDGLNQEEMLGVLGKATDICEKLVSVMP